MKFESQNLATELEARSLEFEAISKLIRRGMYSSDKSAQLDLKSSAIQTNMSRSRAQYLAQKRGLSHEAEKLDDMESRLQHK